MKKVVVASTNPVKINTVRLGFSKMFPKMLTNIEGIAVSSDVSEQPLSEEEALMGAQNRIKNVFRLSSKANFWVGIEGGLQEVSGEMEAFAWIVVKSKNGKMGKGRTASFFLPQKIAELIKQGKELGEADDIVFGRTNSKQINGAVGLLTGNVITRTTDYEQAMILALVPFKNPKLY